MHLQVGCCVRQVLPPLQSGCSIVSSEEDERRDSIKAWETMEINFLLIWKCTRPVEVSENKVSIVQCAFVSHP